MESEEGRAVESGTESKCNYCEKWSLESGE